MVFPEDKHVMDFAKCGIDKNGIDSRDGVLARIGAG
jgi:hypothetical protein